MTNNEFIRGDNMSRLTVADLECLGKSICDSIVVEPGSVVTFEVDMFMPALRVTSSSLVTCSACAVLYDYMKLHPGRVTIYAVDNVVYLSYYPAEKVYES